VAAVVAAAALVSCGRKAETGSVAPQTQPLSAYLSQPLIVTPTSRIRVDTAGWIQRLGGARSAGRQLDSSIARVLSDRAIGSNWFMPAALQAAYERNRSYAADPYNLGTDPLRPSSFVTLSRYGDPLASQLRTMIALHESARFVLVPVELRFDKDGAGVGRAAAILRVVVVDARAAEARWVGEIRGDAAASPAAALARVASRFADHFIAP